MRRRLVELTLALVALGAWVDKHREPTDDYPSDVASVWFDTLYDVVKSEATAPPQASRIYGASAVALYEAVVPGAPHHGSLVGQLNDLTWVPRRKKHGTYHWPTVANAALARTIRGLFPSLKPESLEAINALERRFAAQFQVEVKGRAYERSVAQGQAVADAILAWAATDGFSTVDNCPYVPNPVPGAWEPTPPFPTYTSGHSTQSGAVAAVLTAMFESRAFTDTTHVDHHLMPPQEPRTFSSFDEAAEEAAVSRLYGGIHFAFDNHDGLASGRCIGEAINDRVRFGDEGNG